MCRVVSVTCDETLDSPKSNRSSIPGSSIPKEIDQDSLDRDLRTGQNRVTKGRMKETRSVGP